MSLKRELSEKLNRIAKNPKNEFDRIISENKSELKNLDERQLSEIYMLWRRAEQLCGIIPYEREDVELLALSGEVGTESRVAELCDCFNTLDYIFKKSKGEKF